MKAIRAKMRKARLPRAPPIIGPKESPVLDEATADAVPKGVVVAEDTAWALLIGETTSIVETAVEERATVDDVDVGVDAPESGGLDIEEGISVDDGDEGTLAEGALTSGVTSI
jgi:hypothetical protein